MANFGFGLGAFLQGAQQGLQQGQQLRSTIDDAVTGYKMKKVEKAGRAEADAAREADISKGIISTVDPTSGATTFKVGAQDYGTDSKAARDAATREVGTFTDYYMKAAVPKLAEGYMRAGKPEMAQKYTSWMESTGAKAGMKHWATAARAASRGDTGQFIKSLRSAYNTPGYYDDGAQIVDGAEIKDKDGNVTGIKVNFKGADGKTYSQEFKGMESVYQAGVAMLAPEAVFQYGMKEVSAAQSARTEAGKARRDFGFDVQKMNLKGIIDDRLDGRQHERTLNRDQYQHGYRMTEANNSAAIKAAYDTGAGGSDDESPAELRKQLETITKRMSETDMGFSKLSPEEQNKRAVDELERQRASARGIYGGGSGAVAAPGAPSLY